MFSLLQVYQTNVEVLESLHDRGCRLPGVLQQWAKGVAVLCGEEGQPKRLSLLERALFFAQLRQHLCVPTARLSRVSLLPLHFPATHTVVALQMRIGRLHYQRGLSWQLTRDKTSRTMRAQERSMGVVTGGARNEDDGTVVAQWLERTAAPPRLSRDDCEVQPTAKALVLFSSALANAGVFIQYFCPI